MLCLAWRLPSLTRRSDSLLLIDWMIGDIILVSFLLDVSMLEC